MIWQAFRKRRTRARNLQTRTPIRRFFLKMSFIRQKTARKTAKVPDRQNHPSNALSVAISHPESTTAFLHVKGAKVFSSEVFVAISRTRAGVSRIVRWTFNTGIIVNTAD